MGLYLLGSFMGQRTGSFSALRYFLSNLLDCGVERWASVT